MVVPCGVLGLLQLLLPLQENNWGGGDSNRKAANLEAELIDMFRTKKQLYRDDVEDYLNAYLDDNFGTYAEDGR
jgi:Pre-rRNA-processing protein TSR2